MKIELLSIEEHDVILNIQKEHSLLTYQQKGYDEFDKSKMTIKDKEAFNQVETILKNHIKGFSRFQNFCIKKDEIVIRFQYNYGYDGGHHFIGVGYVFLNELLNGFDSE
jgi:hypothetical protein